MSLPQWFNSPNWIHKLYFKEILPDSLMSGSSLHFFGILSVTKSTIGRRAGNSYCQDQLLRRMISDVTLVQADLRDYECAP